MKASYLAGYYGLHHDASTAFVEGYRSVATRLDDNRPVQKILNWQGLKLGLQYLPGDLRHQRTLTAAYGHVRGTYGQADDGMAIDVWVNLGGRSQKLWRLQQLTQDGSHDEYKYILGCATAAKAKALYTANMPKKLMGRVSPAKVIDITPIQVSKQPNRKTLQQLRPA